MRKLFLFLALIFFAGCQQIEQLSEGIDPEKLLVPPRRLTQTAQAERVIATPDLPTPVPITQVTNTPEPTRVQLVAEVMPVLTVWVGVGDQRHRNSAELITTQFAQSSDSQINLITIPAENLMSLARSATLTDTLPDLIIHSSEIAGGLAELGIIDSAANLTVADSLGLASFETVGLTPLTNEDGTLMGIPLDAWAQVLVYRLDWFETAGLGPPNTLEAIEIAAEQFYTFDDNSITGIVVPTEPQLTSTQRIFEQIGQANGCQLQDDLGNVALLDPTCLEALDFYNELVNQYSPPDYQTDITAFKSYLDGRTSMIITNPSFLPMLSDNHPTIKPRCPECEIDRQFLVKNTAVSASLSGFSGQTASLGQSTVIALTQNAGEGAANLAQFWLSDGYQTWLDTEPETMMPMRTAYQDQWTDYMTATYGTEMTAELRNGIFNSSRWGGSPNSVVLSDVYDQVVLSPVLQKMLSGFVNSSQAIVDMNIAIIDTIPNYAPEGDSP